MLYLNLEKRKLYLNDFGFILYTMNRIIKKIIYFYTNSFNVTGSTETV